MRRTCRPGQRPASPAVAHRAGIEDLLAVGEVVDDRSRGAQPGLGRGGVRCERQYSSSASGSTSPSESTGLVEAEEGETSRWAALAGPRVASVRVGRAALVSPARDSTRRDRAIRAR